jgi:hypothetical protein
MKRLAVLLVLVLSVPLAARADEASHRAKAQELMVILHTQDAVQHVSDGLKLQLRQGSDAIVGASPTAAKKADADAFLKQASQMVDAQLSWASMGPAITDIYVKNLTEEQLDGIVAFYKSPAGVALMTNMPVVNSQVSAFGNERLTTTLKPQLTDLINAFREKETSASAPTAPAPAAPAAPQTTR